MSVLAFAIVGAFTYGQFKKGAYCNKCVLIRKNDDGNGGYKVSINGNDYFSKYYPTVIKGPFLDKLMLNNTNNYKEYTVISSFAPFKIFDI